MMRPFSQFVVLTSRCQRPTNSTEASNATVACSSMQLLPPFSPPTRPKRSQAARPIDRELLAPGYWPPACPKRSQAGRPAFSRLRRSRDGGPSLRTLTWVTARHSTAPAGTASTDSFPAGPRRLETLRKRGQDTAYPAIVVDTELGQGHGKSVDG